MADELSKKVVAFDAHSAMSVAAFPADGKLAIQFQLMEDEPSLVVMLPAGAVGHMVAQIKSAFGKLALSADARGTFTLPLGLTGARPFQGPDGAPILLLQFDKIIELAVEISPKNARDLIDAVRQTVEPAASPPSKPN
jgi:hypothetical protein